MELHNVKKVYQTTDTNEVNSMLNNGWTLLKVDTTVFNDQKNMTYVLGWTHEESEEEYKELVKSMPF